MELFHNDYNEMCHPRILERMAACAAQQQNGYGVDEHCKRAADLIRRLCGSDILDVHFLVGGTQANLTVIDAALRPYQAAVGAVSAHINVHETGAVEATGHKVLTVPADDGKIRASQIRELVEAHLHEDGPEHMVQPKLVYLSDSTELGGIYYLRELEEISAVCKEYGLYLFVDGARLGYALEASDNDVSLKDLARLCDVFYIGGTKVGAMFGEAVVISNPAIGENFRYLIKQHGGMLAKGWLLGLQFETLLEDGLYFEISRHADLLADQIRQTLAMLHCPLLAQGRTNQIFAILPDALLDQLQKDYSFCEQQRMDDRHRAVRLCTSWATTQESVDGLCRRIEELSHRLERGGSVAGNQ